MYTSSAVYMNCSTCLFSAKHVITCAACYHNYRLVRAIYNTCISLCYTDGVYIMATWRKNISGYGMVEGLSDIFQDKVAKSSHQYVLKPCWKYASTRNVIIPLEQHIINNVLSRWRNPLHQYIPEVGRIISDALFNLDRFLYSHESEYIILIHRSGLYCDMEKNLGAIQLIACFNPEGLELYTFNEMKVFFDTMRLVNTGNILEFDILDKIEFEHELHRASFCSELLSKGGTELNWPFYGWSLD